jgi:hypothetical protein
VSQVIREGGTSRSLGCGKQFPVGGSLKDKLCLALLFYTVVTKSIDELFVMEERDTLTCLRNYSFLEAFIELFFAPF